MDNHKKESVNVRILSDLFYLAFRVSVLTVMDALKMVY